MDEKGHVYSEPRPKRDNTDLANLSVNQSVNTLNGIRTVPDGMTLHLRELDAQWEFTVVRKFRRIEIDVADLLNGAKFQTDRISVELLPMIDRDAPRKECVMKLVSDANGPGDELLGKGTMCIMLDDSGRVMRQQRRSLDQASKTPRFTYWFTPVYPIDGNAQPLHMVLLLPLEKTTITPIFRFEHIPLLPPRGKPEQGRPVNH